MSKYSHFDNEPRKRSSKLGKFLTNHRREDNQYEVLKMPQPYTVSSPYSKIVDFNAKAKIVCQKTDLTLFLDQCKIIFVGDVEVGKTSLINRFTSGSFNHCYKATRDVDYQMKNFEILNIDYTVGFWDMSGREEYKILNQPYYKNANVIVAVFDLTKPTTLINATRWMKEALSANEQKDPIRFLVGTKSDLLPKRALEGLESHATFIATEIDAEYVSVSSRDGTEVPNLFKRFVSLAFDNAVQLLIRPPDYNIVKNNIKNLGVFKQEIKKRRNVWTWLSSCLQDR